MQADRQQAESWLSWHADDPGPGLRRIAADGAVWLTKTFGAEVTTAGVSGSTSWTFADQSYAYAGLIRRLERLDVTLLRGGPAFRVPAEWAGWWGVGTDDRRRVTATVSGDFTLRDERALAYHRLSTTVWARPSSAVEVSIGPSWARTIDELMFVTDEPHAILGQLVRDDVSLTLRGSWTIAVGLSLECYAMPFIAAGTYHRFWAVAEPDADQLAQRLRAVDFAGADRFQRVELEGNVVLRWDYLPGSHLYLVWSHSQRAEREDVGSIHLERDLTAMGASPAEDSVMLKLEQLLRL